MSPRANVPNACPWRGREDPEDTALTSWWVARARTWSASQSTLACLGESLVPSPSQRRGVCGDFLARVPLLEAGVRSLGHTRTRGAGTPPLPASREARSALLSGPSPVYFNAR